MIFGAIYIFPFLFAGIYNYSCDRVLLLDPSFNCKTARDITFVLALILVIDALAKVMIMFIVQSTKEKKIQSLQNDQDRLDYYKSFPTKFEASEIQNKNMW